LRVLSILVRHGLAKYAIAEAELNALYQRQLSDVTRELIVVDNAVDRDFVETLPGRTLIGGDNSSHEFSGFDRAIAHVGGRIWSFDVVQLGTSAFQQLVTDYLSHFSTRMLERMTARPVALGHIDCHNEAVEILGYQSQHWMRTACFFLPPAEVKALGTFVSVRPDGFFSHDTGRPFLADAPLNDRYRRYLTDWLTGADIGQGVSWHSPMKLTPETLPVFEQRARAIMNEHMLSIRLRAMSCRLTDVMWLAGRMHEDADPLGRRVDWRQQLGPRLRS
jgi:hypothetical protein